MSANCCGHHHQDPGGDPLRRTTYRLVLWWVLAINAIMFGVEVSAGLAAGSASLQADALDFLGDAANYAISLLVVGMTSLVRRARTAPGSVDPRIPAMLGRRPARVVTVAVANRTARVAWAIMTRGGTYRKPAAVIA